MRDSPSELRIARLSGGVATLLTLALWLLPAGALICSLAFAGCAETKVEDHAALASANAGPVASAAKLGRVLVVEEAALPADLPDRARHQAEAEQAVWKAVSALSLPDAIPAATVLGVRPAAGWASLDDATLLAAGRRAGADTVMILRVEQYARSGNLYLAIALPPVWWDSKTSVSLRLRLLDVQSGKVLADLRRDRERGGTYVDRAADELPDELVASLRSLIAAP